MSNKYYSLMVGPSEPKKVEMGELNRTTGMPMGPVEEADAVVGRITIPNYSKIMGIRKYNEKGEPTGLFTPVKWNDAAGEVIEIRLMSNCESLDKRYQEFRKLQFNEAEGEIVLMQGKNNYDPVRDRKLIEMLRLHTCNGSNEFRDPHNKHILFTEYDAKNIGDPQRQERLALLEASKLITSHNGEPQRLHVLARIFNVDTNMQDDDIIYALVERAQKDPVGFMKQRLNYFSNAQRILLRAKDLNVISVDVPDAIVLMETEEAVFAGFKKTAADKKIDYVIANLSEPAVHQAFEKIAAALRAKEGKVS